MRDGMTLQEVAITHNMSPSTLARRLQRGYTLEDALAEPVNKRNRGDGLVTKICEQCQQEFTTHKKQQRYCNKKCSFASRKGRNSNQIDPPVITQMYEFLNELNVLWNQCQFKPNDKPHRECFYG